MSRLPIITSCIYYDLKHWFVEYEKVVIKTTSDVINGLKIMIDRFLALRIFASG